jgi:hypothetical protein
MDLSSQLTRIRRFLRDPDSLIWDDNFLLNLFNDVQEEIQNRTHFLENLQALRIPQLFQFSYLYDWEWPFLPGGQSQFYQAFYQHQQANHVYQNNWEIQQVWQTNVDVESDGAHTTQQWELFYDDPGDQLKIRFPNDHRETKFIAYDRKPITQRYLREIQSRDSSYRTHEGVPLYYYVDELDNSLTLYPRPTQANWIDGNGVAQFGDEDTVNSEAGTILRRYDTTLSQDGGIAVDIIDAEYNVFLVYEQNTADLTSINDSSPFPVYLRKYIEYGVLAKAYGANTDGRIRSLAEYWENRFEIGIKAIKKLQTKRFADRQYFMKTKGAYSYSKPSHPRLPSTYPDGYIL